VGNTLSVRRLDDRALGAVVAAALGILLVVVASLMLVPTRGGAAPLVIIAVLSLLVAVPLGWLFAPRALTPGTRSALGAAAGITGVAVPIGALLIGLGTVVGRSDLTVGDTLAALLFVVIGGLVLSGLPLGCLTFVVAGVWLDWYECSTIVACRRRPCGTGVLSLRFVRSVSLDTRSTEPSASAPTTSSDRIRPAAQPER
jgi:hypothetical protein